MQFIRFAPHAVAVSAALAGVFLFALPAGAQVAVTVDGNAVDFAPAPMIQDGRVFVPLRGVFERLGASVVYSNGTINATGNGRAITLQIGSNQATVDGQPETIDVAPFIVGASTFVPLRFVSQALGAGVDWDNADRIVSISTAGAAGTGGAPASDYMAPVSDDDVSIPPPAIPVYVQPDVPAPNDIWQPGYWGWGAYGYYWVPGTWVEPPQPDYLWTPGYWAWNHDRFVWNGGYWATAVGFYGGVNYGAGYYGHGYVGGKWDNGTFRYNTYVSHVNVTIVNTVYVDRTVYVNDSTTRRVSYNGGPHGLAARPQPAELVVAKAPHAGMTPVQQQHVQAAAHDRGLLATVNHDQPPVMAVPRPLSASNPPAGLVPVKPSDRVSAKAPPTAPVAPAPVPRTAAPVAPLPVPRTAPPTRAPEVRAAPVVPAPVPRTAAPVAPLPVPRTAPPVTRAPEFRAVPATQAPDVRVAPVAPAPLPRTAAPVAPAAPATRALEFHAVPAVPAVPVPVPHTAAPPTRAPEVHAAPVAPAPVPRTAAPVAPAAPAAPATHVAPPLAIPVPRVAPALRPSPKPTPRAGDAIEKPSP